MAINETIYKGRKHRLCIDNTPGKLKWNRFSFWTAASDVEFSDQTTLESKLGTFKGVTANENQVAGYAADITLLKSVKNSLSNLITSLSNLVNSINTRLGGLRFYEDSTGKYVVGADSVPKKLGNPFEIRKICLADQPDEWFVGGYSGYELSTNPSSFNFGKHKEIYIQIDKISAQRYGGSEGTGSEMWRSDMGASYNESTGVITVGYGELLYNGGGHVCKMTVLYRD